MKHIYYVILFMLFVSTTVNSQSQFRFHINNINMPMDNKGTLADVYGIPGGSLGIFMESSFLFSGGFFISGYSDDSLWAAAQASASLVENFLPGNVDSSQYDPRYKIYTVDKWDLPFSATWQEWRYAVELGAKFYDGNNDGIYDPVDLNSNGEWDPNEDRPDLIGDGTAWCVYNDGATDRQRFEGVEPQGIEIRQTVFGYYEPESPLHNVIFIRYELLNTGKVASILDNVIFSAWADPDMGVVYYDDMVGSDTLLQSGYLYNSGEDPGGYEQNPPAFFIPVVQGAPAYIPGVTFIDNNSNDKYDKGIDTPLDTAYNNLGPVRGIEEFPGARNEELSAFTFWLKSDPVLGDPGNEFEARNYMMGKLKLGGLPDPCTWNLGEVLGGVNCSDVNPYFWLSGDPVTQIGWLNAFAADYRISISTGPFQLEAGKPKSLIVAYVVGRGTDNINSIVKAREITLFVNNFYQTNFSDLTVLVDDNFEAAINDFNLFQNYPNPFNPTTKISWHSPVSSHQTLQVYDVLGNEVAILVDEYKPAGSYQVDFDASGLPSGVYFYRLTTGSIIATQKMILLK